MALNMLKKKKIEKRNETETESRSRECWMVQWRTQKNLLCAEVHEGLSKLNH